MSSQIPHTPRPSSAVQVLDRIVDPSSPPSFTVQATSGIVIRASGPGLCDLVRVQRPADNAPPGAPAVMELLFDVPMLVVDEDNAPRCFAPS